MSQAKRKIFEIIRDSTIQLYKENNWRLFDCRIDEEFKIFFSKDQNYKSNSFQIESSHFNPYYKSVDEFKKSSSLNFKDDSVLNIRDFQFERRKKIIFEMILDRSDLEISKILPKQTSNITILDI